MPYVFQAPLTDLRNILWISIVALGIILFATGNVLIDYETQYNIVELFILCYIN